MDLNRDNMSVLFTGFQKAFQDAFTTKSKEFETLYAPSVYVAPSKTSIEQFPYLEQFAGMREWVGDRQIKDVSSQKLSVTNRTFEDSVGMPINDIQDDVYGLYTPIIAQMGANAANLKAELVLSALVGNATWIDGKAVFATNRTYGSSTINNYTTSALNATTFNTAYLAMQSYCGHNGNSLRVKPSRLLVGPKLRTTAWDILKNQFSYNASDKVQVRNVNENVVDLVIVPELAGTYDDYWFLVADTDMVKPIVLSDRQAPTFVALDRDTDANVALNDKVLYLTKARAEAAIAIPHLIYAGYVA